MTILFKRPLFINYNYNKYCTLINKNNGFKPPWRVLFFGSDDFSLASLKALFIEYKKQSILSRLEVVTNPKQNVIRKFATNNSLTVHSWPIGELNKFDLGLVVSFGHLIPEKVIDLFPMGMINVHASLLPRWRGAAPIIYALANGDKTTGVTIMKIRPKKFDCGEILLQSKINIKEDTRMPELYTQLSELGATTLVSTIHKLPNILNECKPQGEEGITFAPRVTQKFALADWENSSALQIYNLSRAIDGLFHITTHFNEETVKLHNVKQHLRTLNPNLITKKEEKPGQVQFDKKNKLILVQCKDGTSISCDKISIKKKVINAIDFNNGYLKNIPVEKRIFIFKK